MKRILALLLTVSFVTGMALAQTEVKSVNIVGYSKVSIPPGGQFQLVGLNFTSIGTNAGLSLLELFGTNQLVKNNFNTRADRIYVYDPYLTPSPGYTAFYQKLNGTFYTVLGSIATNPMLYSGDAFWIQSGNDTVATNTVTIMGSVPLNTSIDMDNPLNFVLFTNPFSSDLDINGTNINWIANGATAANFNTAADKIYIWNGTGYNNYYLRLSDGKWHEILGNALATNAIIKVGGGAWYYAKAGFTNNVKKPYSL